MDKKNIRLRKSRLGMRLLAIIFTALIVAMLSYWGIRSLGTRTRWGSEAIGRFMGESGQIMADALEQFQEFVTEKRIKSTDFQEMNLWLAQGSNVGITVGIDNLDDSPYSIEFSDKRVSVYPYIQTSRYETFINYAAFIIAVALCILIVTPYIRRILSDIAHLAEEMDVLASGELEHVIEANGSDELAGLARNIEAMRLSVNDMIQRETAATAANRELIASLSHDLRTPLTKALGYLELLLQNKIPQAEDRRRFLERAYTAIRQVKDRSDELFQIASVEQERQPSAVEYTNSNLYLFFAEMKDYLCSEGFQCSVEPFEVPFRFCMNENDINRILDNLTSNFLKYAEPSHPIEIRLERLQTDCAIVSMKNHIRRASAGAESSGIGIPTMKRLLERQGGKAEAARQGNQFQTRLYFSIAQD